MARGGRGDEAEDYIVTRINALAAWKAVNANVARRNQPGFDVVATNETTGREVLVSVKSVSSGGSRHDYAIGKAFERHPVDIYAFVDMTGRALRTVFLAGQDAVVELGLARNGQYQADRGRDQSARGTWSPKISRGLLEAMGTREAWVLLDHARPAMWPKVTEELRQRARGDAPVPKGR
jgi:hypothetical protein